AHTDPKAVITLDARQSNGEPLPGWVSFNPVKGTLSGAPPSGKPTSIEVQVLARDNQAREAAVIFKLELGAAAATTAGSNAALGSSDRGFPVARVALDSAASSRGVASDPKSLTGDRLFVLEGVRNAVGEQRYQLPTEAFAHTDAKALVRLEARQASGAALPAWMEFDPASGVFRGTPPDGKPMSLEVIVIARDNQAREATVVFTLEMGVKGADAPSASPARETGWGGGGKPVTGVPAERGRSDTQGNQPRGELDGDQAAETLKFAQGGASGAEVVSEARLFAFQGVFDAEGDSRYQIPTDLFVHTDPSAVVRLEAQSADGGPLPPWLQFDELSGIFRGTPPGGGRTALEIVLIARDEEGREAAVAFTLELGVKVADPAPVKADAGNVYEPTAWSEADEAGEEQVADASGSATGEAPTRERVEKAKPGRAGAAPFAEQVRVAKAMRDPLLAKILGGNDKPAAKPGARPRA
ncbi:MAG: putative Ig domain-containing protein, partial [Betaproteobacteria bacterium]